MKIFVRRGGVENCQISRTNSTDRLREMRTKGVGGVENPENFVDVLYVLSLRRGKCGRCHADSTPKSLALTIAQEILLPLRIHED